MFTGDERRLRISGKTVFFAGIAAGETEARAFRLNGEGAFENREDVTVLPYGEEKGEWF